MKYIEALEQELEERLLNEPRMKAAIKELQNLILANYPRATFKMGFGDDPLGIHISATVDVEDTDDVVGLYFDRLNEMQLDEGLPIYLIVIRPIERTTELLRQRKQAALSA